MNLNVFFNFISAAKLAYAIPAFALFITKLKDFNLLFVFFVLFYIHFTQQTHQNMADILRETHKHTYPHTHTHKLHCLSVYATHPSLSSDFLPQKPSQWCWQREEKTASLSTLSRLLFVFNKAGLLIQRRTWREGKRRGREKKERVVGEKRASTKASQSSFEFHLIFPPHPPSFENSGVKWKKRNQLWSTPEYYFEHPATHSLPVP